MADIAELGLYIDSSGVVKATKSLRKLEGQSGKNEAANKKLKSSFSGLTAVAGALASSLIVKKFIDTAGAFESMGKSLETVTGSAEKANMAMDGIRQFAQDTPFQVSEITQAFIKLKALGIQPTEENLRSFGNTSAAMGKSLNQMIEAVADAATGEFERLKEFGIKARSEGDNVSLTFQGVTTTIGKNSEEITAYLEEIGQTQFAGAMSMQMDTVNGKISNLGDAVDNLFVTFAEAGGGEGTKGALDSLISGVNFLTEGVEMLPGLFVSAIAEFDKMATSISFGARSLYEDITGIFDSESEKLERQKALNDERVREIGLINQTAQAFISAEEEKRNAVSEEGAIGQAGAESPEVAAEKEALKAAAIAEAQNEAWADEFFRKQEHEEHMIDLEHESAQRRKEIAEQEAAARQAVVNGMFSNLVSLMNSGSKKMFNIGKVAAIANGLLNLRESVVSAYAAGSEVGGPILGAAYAATAGLAQAANLAKIKSSSFGGGGGAATVSSTTGGQPVTGQLQMEPPSQAQQEPQRDIRGVIKVESEGAHSPAMRQFLEDLKETAEDMGGTVTLAFE